MRSVSLSSTSNPPTTSNPSVVLPSRKNSNSYSMEYLYLNLGEGQRAGSAQSSATRHTPCDVYTTPYKCASRFFYSAHSY